MSNLFARSSRKRASWSHTSVRKISSSMASAVDRVVANGVRNMQEHSPCWQACLLVCKRIIASDHGSTRNA